MLDQIIRKAQRRLLFNEALRQFAVSAALAIAGVALLLTVGTRYLEWWVIALFAGGLAIWAYVKLRRHWPGEYTAAVWLDEKAGLHDALSTAHHFSKTNSADRESEAVLLAQRGQAETAADSVDIAATVPFRFPKGLYALGALLAVSGGLVGIRYFYTHTLDLSAPITEVIFRDLANDKPPAKADKTSRDEKVLRDAKSMLERLGLDDKLDGKNQQLDEALADALNAEPAPSSAQNESVSTDPGDPSQMQPDDSSPPDPQSDGPQNNSPSGNSPDAGSKSSNEGEEKSLLSKLMDAMDDMLGAGPKGGQQAGNSKKQQNVQSKTGKGKGSQTPKGEQSPDDEQSASKETDPGSSPPNAAGKSDHTEGPAIAGREEGSKALKAAQQLAAMGKISELIGKRSEKITGESMVEVQSGNQQLQTAYTEKSTAHGEGAGEVSRDTIPLSVQAYVREYFEQVRKSDATSGPTLKPVAPSAKKP